jgi:hypothetical protein
VVAEFAADVRVVQSVHARRRRLLIQVPSPPGRDSPRRRRAREALARAIWDDEGNRRIVPERVLVEAIEACEPRDVWWVCESSSAGPVYFLPTREWLRAFSKLIDELGAKTIVEVAAGDGFLSAAAARARPDVRFIATDSGAWRNPARRMSNADRREFAGIDFAGIRSGANVVRMAATTAVKRFRPDLVVVAWAPPGTLVDRVIRAPSRFVLDISVDGDVCGNGMRTWRFEKEFLSGPIEDRALCRLDTRPSIERKTRVTLYYGARHPQHGVNVTRRSAAALS